MKTTTVLSPPPPIHTGDPVHMPEPGAAVEFALIMVAILAILFLLKRRRNKT